MNEKTTNVLAFLIASFLSLVGIVAVAKVGLGGMLVAIPCGMIAGMIFARLFTPYIGGWLGGTIYWGSASAEPPPPQFPEIRAKIANGKYGEAVAELRAFLKENGWNPHAVELLANVFMDGTHEYDKAGALLRSYLSSKDTRDPGDLKFIMTLCDIYLEMEDSDAARAFLENESRKSCDKASLKSIENRRENMIRTGGG